LRSFSSGYIDKIIDRFANNAPERGAKNTHLIKKETWIKYFENLCEACKPRYAIVDAEMKPARVPIRVDDYDNIRVDTSEGIYFKGFLMAHFNSYDPMDQSCARINRPVYVPMRIEICG
jgi:hypothetical protein